MEYYIELVK